ncbi:hypothetical protein H0H93_015856 [Arthromyces matolae]|nr:hypothetical protein H0H93_015856 [Arthromyces matolae]
MFSSIPRSLLAIWLLSALQVHAIKFVLPAQRYPQAKCIWNSVHSNQLVIVTANVGPGDHQRLDVDIVDSSPQNNVYLSKRGIKSESRLAVTTHSEGEIGVCFKNTVEGDVKYDDVRKLSRVIDLDVDIGADAVDYKPVKHGVTFFSAIANLESLSGLETEMRKLEGVVKEIVDEMEYLKTREARFSSTNLSTNVRVQNFAWFTLVSLIGLGAWQIFHLRAFFKQKYLID